MGVHLGEWRAGLVRVRKWEERRIKASYIESSFEKLYCKGGQRNGWVTDWRSRIKKSFLFSILSSFPPFFLLMGETIMFCILMGIFQQIIMLILVYDISRLLY